MSDAEKYYEMAIGKLNFQFQTIDCLNAKVNTLLVVCGVLLAVLSELVSRGMVLMVLPGGAVLHATFWLAIAYWVRNWQHAPNPDRIKWSSARNEKIETFFREAIEAVCVAYDENESHIEKKSTRIKRASITLVVALCLFVIGGITYLAFPVLL